MFILTLIPSGSDAFWVMVRARARAQEWKEGRVPGGHQDIRTLYIGHFSVKNTIMGAYACVNVRVRARARAATRVSAFCARCELRLGDIERWPLICA